MVARPTTTPTFATGASRRLEPDAGEKSNGFREAFRFAARKANWALGYAVDWIGYLAAIIDTNEEHTYQAAKTRKTVVSLWDGISPDGFWSHPSDALPGSANYWWESANPYAQLVFPLNQYLRDGMTIDQIKVIVDPTAANATGADRMSFILVGANPNFGTPAAVTPAAIGSIPTDDGTAAFQTITQNYGNAIVRAGDNALDYYLLVLSANEASGDRVYGVELTVTDPGPRNV